MAAHLWHGASRPCAGEPIARRRVNCGKTNSRRGGISLRRDRRCLHGMAWFFHAEPEIGLCLPRRTGETHRATLRGESGGDWAELLISKLLRENRRPASYRG